MPRVLVVALLALLVQHGAADAADDEVKVTYEGAQVWRVIVDAMHKSEVQKLGESGDIEVISGAPAPGNRTNLDLIVRQNFEVKFKEFLTSRNLTYEVMIEDLQGAVDAQMPPTLSAKERDDKEALNGHLMSWDSYHRLSDIHGYLDYLARTYPDLCSVETIGSSVEGRPLKLLTIKYGRPDAPAMWIDGGVHANEWITPATVTYLINELVTRRDDPAIQGVDFYIHAVVNPDGYEYSHERNRFWRKNRGNTEANCTGVDLNRNFGYKWGGEGSSRNPCKQTFAGTSQFSEPETQAINNFVMGRNFTFQAYLSFHSYGQYIIYPWGYDYPLPLDHLDLQKMGLEMGAAMHEVADMNFTVGPIASTFYPASGSSADWAKGAAMIKYTYGIELRDKGRFGFVLPSHYIVQTAQEALAAVKTLAKVLTD